MTLRWDLTEDAVFDIVRDVLAEEAELLCEHLPHDGPIVAVDIDQVSAEIARKLVAKP